MAKLKDRIEALERRVGRRRAAHQKLVARAERTQKRMAELAEALVQAEKALGDAVARVAARQEAKVTRRRAASNGAAKTAVPAKAEAPAPAEAPAAPARRTRTPRTRAASATTTTPATATARRTRRTTAAPAEPAATPRRRTTTRRTTTTTAADRPATTTTTTSNRRGRAR